MKINDILRVMAELKTFTSDDVAEALEMTRSAANARFSDMLEGKWLIRVKSGHNYLYALSEKAERRVASLPAIDPDERCLLIERVPVGSRYLTHNGVPVIDKWEDEIPDALKGWYCDYCAAEIDTPFGKCETCGASGLG